MKRRICYSTLKDHKQNKKIFTPPLLMDNTHLVSWTNDGLPELLWIALLNAYLPREVLFHIFSKIGDEVYGLRQENKIGKSWDCTISGLASLDSMVFQKIMRIVLSFPNTVDALRPILLFKKIPGYKRWKKLLNAKPLLKKDWDQLCLSVESNFVYQSQEVTDCCLLNIVFGAVLDNAKK